MVLVTRNKIKLVLALLVAAGFLHLVIDKGQSIYENFDRISTYLDEPFSSVLRNTLIYHQNGNYSTVSYLFNDTNVGAHSSVHDDLLLNGSSPDEGRFLNTSFSFTQHSPSLEICPLIPPRLVGPIRVWMDSPSFSALQKLYPYLEPGGHGKPEHCRSRHRVAVVVPYRDRDSHLRILLHNLHSLLTKQQLDYAIIIVEQIANQTFNRAKLMNVGYAEGIKLYPWECFIFHDVDLLPEDDRNLYSCPTIPRHMSVAIDKFNYKLPYSTIFGGITAMTVDQFQSINGFSNRYWGWGGEDDDLAERVAVAGYQVARYPAKIARYKMIKHAHEAKTNPLNNCRYKLMAHTKEQYQMDGLNSLKYEVVKHELLPLYTHILVDLFENEESMPIKKSFNC